MLIEIKGAQFVNKGAELMLFAVLQKIAEFWPQAEIAMAPNPNSPYKKRASIQAFQKLVLRKRWLDFNSLSYVIPKAVRSKMRSYGLVTEADIDIVFDISGFAYGDQWSSMSIAHLCSEINRYAAHNKSYCILPQALGPFTRKVDIEKLQKALPKAKIICAREEESKSFVASLNSSARNLFQFGDFTNLVKGNIPDYWVNGEEKVCFVPNSKMLSSRNQNRSWLDRYTEAFCELIQASLEKGYQPVLLNHDGEADQFICDELAKKFTNPTIEVINEADSLKVKGILGNSAAVVCSRFHGCVSALSQAVPCIGTSWSHKYEKLFAEYDVSDWLISPDDSESKLRDLLGQMIDSKEEFTEKLAERADLYIQQSEKMWQLVKTQVE